MCALQVKGPYRILLVDDDVDLVMLLERKLLQAGFEVETAISLREAEETLAYFHPHLLLLDINLNGEDGRKLSFKLKRSTSYAALRILILSGYDCSPTRAALFGADEAIAKPVHFDFLLNRIEHHLLQATASLLKRSEEREENKDTE